MESKKLLYKIKVMFCYSESQILSKFTQKKKTLEPLII